MFRVATKFTEIGEQEKKLIDKTIEEIEKFIWYRNLHLQREADKKKK